MLPIINTETIEKYECPACANGISVNNGFSFNTIFPEHKKYLHSLSFIENLKFSTSLYTCKNCNEFWILKDNFMRHVPNKMIRIIEEWNSKKLKPSQEILQKLLKIKGCMLFKTHGDILFPCKCKTKNDENIDFCVVSFQKGPPRYNQEKIILIDQIEDIHESQYALSAEIRRSSINAPELWMGFYPTVIESKEKKEKFIIDHGAVFFNENGLKGEQMQLVEDKEIKIIKDRASLTTNFPRAYRGDSNWTWIIADWNDRYLQENSFAINNEEALKREEYIKIAEEYTKAGVGVSGKEEDTRFK